MKLSAETEKLFAKDIARAKARGMAYWAKSVCCPTMRFGFSLEEAERKACRDARRLAREAGCPDNPPRVQSAKL